MRRYSPRVSFLLVAIAVACQVSCGKRADPLAPYVRTPGPPSGLEVSQVGEEIEIRVLSPQTTTENRPLPVIELEWLEAPATGAFGKVATTLFREDVAPGELRVKRFPRPLAETRFSVRAHSGRAESSVPTPAAFKAANVPQPPTAFQATNLATGVELRWLNPPGAEPWPSPTPSPTPTPTPSPSPGSSPRPLGSPSPSPSTGPTPTPTPGPSPGPLASSSPSPSVRPPSTPPPAPPTGIRIFRTDGALRLAQPPLQDSTWLDTTVKPGDKPCYSLRYAASIKPLVESAPLEPVCVEVKDLVPPAPPDHLVGDIGASFVELSWTESPSTDTAFYRLYRSIDTGPRSVAVQTEGLVLRVQDADMTKGSRTYEIVAVDKAGNESLPGPPLKIALP